MGVREEYLDIPAVARRGLLTEEQYEKQRNYTSHNEIAEMVIYRFNLKRKLNILRGLA